MLRKSIILLLTLLISCATQVRSPETRPRITPKKRFAAQDQAQIIIYARSLRPVSPPLRWEIRKIALNKADGSQISIARSQMSLSLADLANSQKLLAISEAEAGDYIGLTIFTANVYSEATGDMIPIERKFMTVSHDFSIIAGNAKTFTLAIDLAYTGDPRESVVFKPRLTLEDENPRPKAKLAYVSNELSSTISVIDKSLMRVVYNVFVGTKPYALGADQRRNRLYIADRKDGVIYEMDMTSHHLLRATEIEFVDEPVHIEPIPDRDLLMVVNYGSNSVYLIDSFTSQIVETIQVAEDPVDAVYSPLYDLIFVLSKAYGTLSVIDLSSEPVEVDTALRVEREPMGLAIDDSRRWLFVSNSGSIDLSVIEIERMAVERTVTVGVGAGDLAFDPFGRRLYIGMINTNEVLCVDPFTGVLAYRVRLPSTPGRLLFDSDEKKLFVTVPERNAVAVIDPLRRQIRYWIETGYGPSSMAVRF